MHVQGACVEPLLCVPSQCKGAFVELIVDVHAQCSAVHVDVGVYVAHFVHQQLVVLAHYS